MHFIVPTVICVLILVALGVTLSAGFLQSADYLSSALETGNETENELMRTKVSSINATAQGSKLIAVAVENTGQTKLTDFPGWDVFIEYYDNEGALHSKRLAYSSDSLEANEWTTAGLFYEGVPEVFDPGLLNSGEHILLDLLVEPLPAWNTTVTIYVATPNGVSDSVSYDVVPGDFVMVPHSETVTISGDLYCELKESIMGDGAGTTMTSPTIGMFETGRWLLYNSVDSSMYARYVYSLSGIEEIPSYEWTVYYRAYATNGWQNNPFVNVDIVIRQADGAIRQTIVTNVATGYISSYGSWETISGSFTFPGYLVANDTDYLEVDFYANVDGRGSSMPSNNIQIQIDDAGLAIEDQTRIQ